VETSVLSNRCSPPILDLQRFLIKTYQYVISRYDVDGFRIDTLRFLKGDLARLFGNSIREFALSIREEKLFYVWRGLGFSIEDDIARFIGTQYQ